MIHVKVIGGWRSKMGGGGFVELRGSRARENYENEKF